MKVSVVSTKDNEASFLLEGVSPEYMNTVRRAISFEMPTLAIEDVHFIENSSALYDEMIAHRLGLIPLKLKGLSDIQDYAKIKEKLQVVFELKKEGPGMVYAKDLVPKSKDVEILYPDTPIVKLVKNQKIDLKATAIIGTGRDHMKWSPGLVYYSNYTTAKVGGKEVKGKDPVEFSRRLLDIGEEAVKLEGIKGKATTNVADDKFILTVESWGQLSPKELLAASVKVIKAKVKDLKVK